MSPLLPILDTGIALLGLFIVYRLITGKSWSTSNVPPGPAGLPIVGNVLDMPTSHPHLTFAKWAKKWGMFSSYVDDKKLTGLLGNIISVKLLTQRLIILNDPDDAVALLDKRGSNYSDRPSFTMGAGLVGWKEGMLFRQYDDQFKQSRRYVSHVMGSKNAVKSHHGLIELENRNFMRRVLETPKEVHAHIRKCVELSLLCSCSSIK